MKNRLVQYLANIYIGKEPLNDRAVKAAGKKLSLDILWLLAFAPHSFFLIYFIVADIKPMLITNAVSLILYIMSRFILSRGYVMPTARLILIEIYAYVMISVYFLGPDSQTQWYLLLILIPVFNNLEYSTFNQVFISAAVIIGITLCMIYGKYYIAPYAYSTSVTFLYYFNSIFIVFAIILEILMENVVDSFVLRISGNDIELLRQQSYRDPLTNLYNRRYADIIFAEIEPGYISRRTAEKYAVAMIDIDNFKKINDCYGHDVGDAILKKTAGILQKNIRRDDYLFRWGGEEFLAVFQGVDLERATVIAQNLCNRVAQSIYTYNDNLQIAVTITIGIAPIGIQGFKDSITIADRNMYEGKRCGKNCVKTSKPCLTG